MEETCRRGCFLSGFLCGSVAASARRNPRSRKGAYRRTTDKSAGRLKNRTCRGLISRLRNGCSDCLFWATVVRLGVPTRRRSRHHRQTPKTETPTFKDRKPRPLRGPRRDPYSAPPRLHAPLPH